MKKLLTLGLVLASFQANAQVPAATTTNHPIVHVEILGADAPRLQRFYNELFGWTVTLNPIGYGYVPIAPTP